MFRPNVNSDALVVPDFLQSALPSCSYLQGLLGGLGRISQESSAVD